MIDNVRKYNLSLTSEMSYGIGVTGGTTIFNLLDGFTTQNTLNSLDLDVIYANDPTNNTSNIGDTVTCYYPAINCGELIDLNICEYDKRVRDFLTSINIENGSHRDQLIEDSSYNNGLGISCGLNPDFLVYIFFSGVRIVNVGKTQGTAEYKAYLFGSDPNSQQWQTNPTYIGLQSEGVYVFEVRDLHNGVELCKVTQTISISNLVQSTTQAPTDIQIYINEVINNRYYDTHYSCGSILGNPALKVGEKIKINYSISSEASGIANSVINICCNSTKICTVNSVGVSPLTGSVIMNVNDTVTYDMINVTPSPGDCACSCFELTSVEGLNSTNPTIDVGRCSVSISDLVETSNVVVSVSESSLSATNNNGTIVFNPEIPVGKWIDIDFCSAAYACLGATAAVSFCCCAAGSASSTIILNNSQRPQPTISNVRMNYGDELFYSISTNVCATQGGSCGSGRFRLFDTTSSSGINAVIDPNTCSKILVNEVAATSAVVSVCRQNFLDKGFLQRVDGLINISPTLSGNQSVSIAVCSLPRYIPDCSRACAEIFCKPNGSTSFVPMFNFPSQNYGDVDFGTPSTRSITYNAGDQICYNLETTAFEGSLNDFTQSESDIEIYSVLGQNGVNASINPTSAKQGDYVCAFNGLQEHIEPPLTSGIPSISSLAIGTWFFNDVEQKSDITITTTGDEYDGYELVLQALIKQNGITIKDTYTFYSSIVSGSGTSFTLPYVDIAADSLFPNPLDFVVGWSGVEVLIIGSFALSAPTANDSFISSLAASTTTL